MHKKNHLLPIIGLSLNFFFNHAFAAEAAGTIIFVHGQVRAQGSQGSRTLSTNSQVYAGDSIMTRNGAYAQLRYTDGTMVSIQPDSDYKIASYYYKPGDTKDNNKVQLITGDFHAISGEKNTSVKDANEIQTPVAVMGIRGTSYYMNYAILDDIGKVVVSEGSVCSGGKCVGSGLPHFIALLSPTGFSFASPTLSLPSLTTSNQMQAQSFIVLNQNTTGIINSINNTVNIGKTPNIAIAANPQPIIDEGGGEEGEGEGEL